MVRSQEKKKRKRKRRGGRLVRISELEPREDDFFTTYYLCLIDTDIDIDIDMDIDMI